MKDVKNRMGPWAAAVAVALALTACGGGGGDATPAASATSAVADGRNGNYTLVAANAREYTLALDFDAGTYRVSGNGVDQSGLITAQGNEFLFQPGNSTGASGTSTTRFTLATETAVGEFALPDGTVPFIAPRQFVNTVASAAGIYNMLGRTVDPPAAPNNTVQQGEITADGQFRLCNDMQVLQISACPPASVSGGPITVAGDTFTAATATGPIVFRVAQVGADKVFLRGSASTNTARRFMVGVPASTAFAPGTFAGGTTEPGWGTVSIGPGSYASASSAPSGVVTTRSGTTTAIGSGSLGGVLGVSTTGAGFFFAARSAELGVVFAARGSTLAPGFVAIGRAQ
jgi:hypothetical protein